MNGSIPAERFHKAFISLGSNIDPFTNLPQAIRLLREQSPELSHSRAYESKAVGSNGPNFINLAAGITTPLEALALKEQVLRPIEARLGRVRTANKYAPRPIDLDILVFDGQVLAAELWQRVYLALPLSELLPDLAHPTTGLVLREAAQLLLALDPIQLRPDFPLC